MVEVGFTQSVYTVGEGEGGIELLVTKSGLNAREVGVAFTTEDGTAKRKSPLSQCSLHYIVWAQHSVIPQHTSIQPYNTYAFYIIFKY